MADREMTLEDILALQDTSNEVTPESLPVARAAPVETSALDNFKPIASKALSGDLAGAAQGYVDLAKKQGGLARDAASLGWSTYAAETMLAEAGIEFDPTFDLGKDVPEKEWALLTEGLDDDIKERIADASWSKTHLYFLARDAKSKLKTQQNLADNGWGIAPQLLVDTLDPTNVVLAIATGGSSVALKSKRIADTLRRVKNLDERRTAVTALVQAANTTGTTSSVLKTATFGAAENAVIEQLLVSGDVTRDEYDVALAGVIGFGLTGGVARYTSGAEREAIQRMKHIEVGKLETAELAATIDAKRVEITAALADVNAARADVDSALARAGGFVAERDGDLGGYQQFRHILESGGRADAKATSSSATGIDQFTEGTWLNYVNREKPTWAEGLSREQKLELRKDPAKSGEMVAALNRDVEAALRRANAPVNNFTMYAGHHFGEKKGTVFALAKPETKMEDILSPGQLNANAYLKGKTKSEAIAIWTKRAKKGGWDPSGAVTKAGATRTETRARADVDQTDPAATQVRIDEIEQSLAREKVLEKEGEGILSTGEARKLQREVDDLKRELSGGHKTPSGDAAKTVASLEARLAGLEDTRAGRLKRMHDEDVAKLGEEVANNKQRTKLRESSLDNIMDVDRKNLKRQLAEAKDTRGRARYQAKTRLSEVSPRLESHTKASQARTALKALREQNKPLAGERQKLADALGARKNGEQALKDADAARADTLTHLKATSGKAADLDRLDALDNVQSATDLRMSELESFGHSPAFGGDTLSAAKTLGFDPGLHPALEGTSSGIEVGKMKLAGALRALGKGTFSGVLRGSDNPVVRNELGLMVGNPLGEVGDTVTALGASEIQSTMLRKAVGKFNSAINPAYEGWLKERGMGADFLHKRVPREQFMHTLGLAIRGENIDSAAVNSAVGRVREVFSDFLKEAKEAGVPGFEHVNPNGNYLPRVFDFHAIHALSQTVSYEELSRLIAGGVRQMYPELDEKTALKLGDAYMKRMRELRMGNDVGLMQGMSFDDVGFLRQFLGETGMGSDEVEEIVGKFAAAKRPSKAATKPLATEAAKLKKRHKLLEDRWMTRQALGKKSPKAIARMQEISTRLDEIAEEIKAARDAPDATDVINKEGGFRHAKRRVQFDENFSMHLRDIKANDGTTVEVKISQLFNNNVEALFGRYSRTMSGHISLAKVGIKSRADFNTRLRRVERALENEPAELENVKRMANAAYDLITARPLEGSSLWTELGRTGRDLSYASQMENVGLSNIPDLAALGSYGNFQLSAKTFFGGDVFGALWKRGENGRLVDLEWREIEETFGEGTDFLANQVHSSYDISEEYAQALKEGGGLSQRVSSAFASISHGARVVSRGVTAGSGLAAISAGAQRIATKNVLSRIKNDVLRGKDGFSEARYASLGLSKEMRDRVAAQFRKHVSEVKGEFGGKYELNNIHAWDDMDARDALMYAVTRESRKNVQATDLGDTMLWQHKGMGKVASQFRQFGLTAWTKQTLRGVAERDAETITRVLMQMTMAAGVWKLKHEMVLEGMELAGVDQEKIDAYREKNLSPRQIGFAGVRNSGVASVLPDISDSITNLTAGVKVFDTRNSGLKSGLLDGIPLVSWVTAFGNAAGGTIQAMVREDRQFTKATAKAWQSLIPFAEHIFVAPAVEALTADLPTAQEDDDPEEVDWSLF